MPTTLIRDSQKRESITRKELFSTLGVATVYALRMLGMFLLLPILVLWASAPGREADKAMAGMGLSAYALTQMLFLIPLGTLSDRLGRKPVIIFGLGLFVAGALIAARAHTLWGMILGRALQGSGAVSSALMALLSDLTRDEVRTRAMAVVGMGIGVAFAASLVLGPPLYTALGMPGIFYLMAALGALAMAWVAWGVPSSPVRHPALAQGGSFWHGLSEALRRKTLLRLDFGVMSLHATQMAMWVVVPLLLVRSGLPLEAHAKVYLPVMALAFALMLPVVAWAEIKDRIRQVMLASIVLIASVEVLFGVFLDHPFWQRGLLAAYFVGFNVLEAILPSWVSKAAPLEKRGMDLGVYNTAQSLGIFLGGALGGLFVQWFGERALFLAAALACLAWWLVAIGIPKPPAVRTRSLRIASRIQEEEALRLKEKLLAVPGVVEAAVFAQDGVVLLKVAKTGLDEQRLLAAIGEV